MSEFECRVFKVKYIQLVENADNLSLTYYENYPVIFKNGDFSIGDLAVYVCIDAILPDKPEYSWLSNRRIKAKKLRGTFSMGLLLKSPEGCQEGDEVSALLEITKWEPNIPIYLINSECEKDPGFLPIYTDINGLRKYSQVLLPEEEVILTEKLHGANGRWLWKDNRLWVGSHTKIKKESESCPWWIAAKNLKFEEKLSQYPDLVFYGELYGQVQKGYSYDISPEDRFGIRIFDIYNIESGRYLNYDAMVCICKDINIQTVPLLYRGPWNREALEHLSNGKSALSDKTIREGFVVKPIVERWHRKVGRVIFKMPGQDYLIDRGKR